MNSKIENYIEILFQDIPRSRKATELKEELLSNCNDKYEGYLKEGMSENQAYTQVIAGMGDIDSLLAGLEPDIELKKEIEFYTKRKAKATAIGVMLYILSAAVLIGSSLFGLEEYGTILLLVICAVATGIIVYANMSIPLDIVHYMKQNQNNDMEFVSKSKETRAILGSLRSILWLMVVILYFVISFATMAWYITWVIFLIGAALEQMLKIFFEMRG